MGASTDLYDLCAQYLAACAACLADTPEGAPDRQYVSPGPPAWDCCPQLTVFCAGPSVAETSPGTPALAPGQRITTTYEVFVVSLTATVTRCVPTLNRDAQPPPPGLFASPSRQITADVWSLWNGLRAMKRAGTLFADSCAREFWFDQPQAVNQQGGCGGWDVPVRVQLSGYTPA